MIKSYIDYVLQRNVCKISSSLVATVPELEPKFCAATYRNYCKFGWSMETYYFEIVILSIFYTYIRQSNGLDTTLENYILLKLLK